MSAGKYNRLGMLQRTSTSEDALGQPVATWVDVGTAWANIQFKTGMATIKEEVKADAKTSKALASVRLRFRQDVQPGWRFVYQSTAFNVKGLAPDLVERKHVDLICEVDQ